MGVKELMYPFLLECIAFTTDPYWKSIFEELAYCSPPYSTYISKDVIICNIKDREFAYKIQRKSPEILYNEISDIFRKKLGLSSPSEILSNKNNICHCEELYDDWAMIKKKNIRKMLVERYLIEMKNKYSLSVQQTRFLDDIIFLSLILRVLLPVHIIINKGVIENIVGITFEMGKINVNYNMYDVQTGVHQPEFIIDENLMSTNWYKFLNTLRKLNLN
jgi:hypothetical protein